MGVVNPNAAWSWAEVVKLAGFDDEAAVLGEIAQSNEWWDECPMFPSSHGLYNKQLQAKRLAKGNFSRAYGAVTDLTSQTDEQTVPLKLYDGDSPVDDRVFEGVPEGGAYSVRDGMDSLNLEGLIQDLSYLIVYNNEGDNPDGWKGLWSLRPRLSPAGAALPNCWDFKGTGADVTSGILVEFGKRGFYMVYPGGSGVPGLKNEDRGLHKIPVPVGTGMYWAWIRHYEFWGVPVLRNSMALHRLANIETQGASNIFDPSIFITAKDWLPGVGRNAASFFNRTVKAQIDNNAYNKTNIQYSIREIQNYGPIAYVGGVPARLMEALLNSETAITT